MGQCMGRRQCIGQYRGSVWNSVLGRMGSV